ncbi:MAG: hypothetical protein Q7J29_00050 [Stagnimonas sp.]|nr:hypothetical protein [Stagnimonas sp.]
MTPATPTLESRLRLAATLLMSLPAVVATACFAHGHGALGSYSLLALLVVAIAAGSYSAYQLLTLLRTRQNTLDGLPTAATTSTL